MLVIPLIYSAQLIILDGKTGYFSILRLKFLFCFHLNNHWLNKLLYQYAVCSILAMWQVKCGKMKIESLPLLVYTTPISI